MSKIEEFVSTDRGLRFRNDVENEELEAIEAQREATIEQLTRSKIYRSYFVDQDK